MRIASHLFTFYTYTTSQSLRNALLESEKYSSWRREILVTESEKCFDVYFYSVHTTRRKGGPGLHICSIPQLFADQISAVRRTWHGVNESRMGNPNWSPDLTRCISQILSYLFLWPCKQYFCKLDADQIGTMHRTWHRVNESRMGNRNWSRSISRLGSESTLRRKQDCGKSKRAQSGKYKIESWEIRNWKCGSHSLRK